LNEKDGTAIALKALTSKNLPKAGSYKP